jgi:hypothetical protein
MPSTSPRWRYWVTMFLISAASPPVNSSPRTSSSESPKICWAAAQRCSRTSTPREDLRARFEVVDEELGGVGAVRVAADRVDERGGAVGVDAAVEDDHGNP